MKKTIIQARSEDITQQPWAFISLKHEIYNEVFFGSFLQYDGFRRIIQYGFEETVGGWMDQITQINADSMRPLMEVALNDEDLKKHFSTFIIIRQLWGQVMAESIEKIRIQWLEMTGDQEIPDDPARTRAREQMKNQEVRLRAELGEFQREVIRYLYSKRESAA